MLDETWHMIGQAAEEIRLEFNLRMNILMHIRVTHVAHSFGDVEKSEKYGFSVRGGATFIPPKAAQTCWM